MAYLANYFKRQDLSDIDMVIRLPENEQQQRSGTSEDITSPPLKRARRETDDAADTDPLQLASFPAHRIVLFDTEYFKAQGRLWQAQRSAADTCRNGRNRKPGKNTNNEATQRPSVQLTIDNAEQLPAAEAVIAAIYGVPDAISSLEQQQLVHALVIADMVGAAVATQQALAALTTAAQSEQGLSAAALQALASLAAVPACLLQLLPAILKKNPCCRMDSSRVEDIKAADTNCSMQQLLLAVFGDLDAACADKQLKQLLLSLPLPALQLLLSSDQLRVASEDTVVYVAQRYLSQYSLDYRVALTDIPAKIRLCSKVQAALAPLVRAPHLSLFALSCAALAGQTISEPKQLFSEHISQVRSLLSLKQAATAEQLAAGVGDMHSTPTSWRLGPRQIVPLADGVQLEWRLPVEQLRQACRDSFAQQRKVSIYSPEGTPPMGGLSWQLQVLCMQQGGGTVLGVYAGPRQLSPDMWYRCKFTANWCGVKGKSRGAPTTGYRGVNNVFQLAPMAAGGWDEAVWAAKGLPTSGQMLLQLHVHSVG